MKKFILVAIMALAVTMIANNYKVYASDDPTPIATPTSAPSRINSLVGATGGSGGRLSVNTIFEYYNRHLSLDQKQIVNYLVGMYNYTYISARGFQYKNINTTEQLVNRLVSFGTRFFDAAQDGYASRLDQYMQEYLSAIISYAGTISADFGTWLDSISNNAEEYLYIPFTKDSLNSWTNFYSDPSVYGVENFGVYDSVWESGTYYDFPFGGYTWVDEENQEAYNNFILNQSPVIYTDTYRANSSNLNCAVISVKDVPLYDSLFILRNQNGVPHMFRYGKYDNGLILYEQTLNAIQVIYNNRNIYVSTTSNNINQCQYNNTKMTYNVNSDLQGLIDYAFRVTPFLVEGTTSALQYYHYVDFYPYFKHVYLVDDLDTLANIQEIFNTTDLEITGTDVWINMPVDDYYWQIQPTLNPDLEDLVNVYGDPIPEDGLKQDIVNNTVINNYDIVAPGVVINVPNDWLNSDSDYLGYTNNIALPFFVMVGDIFMALGELRIFIIACLILGLVGGILVKFLL